MGFWNVVTGAISIAGQMAAEGMFNGSSGSSASTNRLPYVWVCGNCGYQDTSEKDGMEGCGNCRRGGCPNCGSKDAFKCIAFVGNERYRCKNCGVVINIRHVNTGFRVPEGSYCNGIEQPHEWYKVN